ncbi:hypothetical protein [Streptomyces phaeoluteigriseus]|uniref:hypothetical protein n=1 Tax=Streptomyces phaeoluteigriseus TaxID=114686 RepID=UPI00338FB105
MELDHRALSCCSRCSPNARRRTATPSPPTSPFGGWTRTFTDPRRCAAIVDRLAFGANSIETGTKSYRLASTRAARGQDIAAN